jgi:ferredoxin
MREVERLCAATLPPAALHTERFAPAAAGSGSASADAVQGDDEDTAFEVKLNQSGITLTVPADKTLLQAVLEHQPAINYSCEEGTCGSCEARVLAGTPLHRDSVLSEAERAAGDTMMICVSRARTPHLTLDL